MHRRMLLSLGLLLALIALVRADGGGDSGAYTLVTADDRAELERGEWKIVSGSIRGMDLPKEGPVSGEMRLVFKGDVVLVKNIKAEAQRGRFTLNSNATPKAIDLHIDPKPNPSIYKLEHDTLTLAIGEGTRPSGFTGKDAVVVFILKRVKP